MSPSRADRRGCYRIGGGVVDAACAYEVAARHSRDRTWRRLGLPILPTFTALSGRWRLLAWALSAAVTFHLLAETRCMAVYQRHHLRERPC